MHPADLRGAIVSLDSSRPFGSWRWGGPDWTERIGSGPPGRLTGITVALAEPRAAAERWAQVLGVKLEGSEQPRLVLDGAEVRFVAADGAEGIVEIAVEVPEAVRGGEERIVLGSAAIALSTLDAG
jgi:hypothetical protein